MRLGRGDHYVPAEDQQTKPRSPAEAIVAAASPELFEAPLTSEEETVVHRPWTPTGDETPQKTIKADKDLEFSPDPPETAGGSIPSAFARFRQFGPDEG